jgi:hypothetical protein
LGDGPSIHFRGLEIGPDQSQVEEEDCLYLVMELISHWISWDSSTAHGDLGVKI